MSCFIYEYVPTPGTNSKMYVQVNHLVEIRPYPMNYIYLNLLWLGFVNLEKNKTEVDGLSEQVSFAYLMTFYNVAIVYK